jgi:colanic acid/amylovoran biosynthesis glycosyltransferase
MLKVVHTCSSWLPQTETWLFNQVKYLPSNIESHIVTQTTENLEQFQLPNIHTFQKESRSLGYFRERFLRKVGVRRALKYDRVTIQKIKPDVLHSHFGNRGWIDLESIKEERLKHVTTFYGADVSKLPSTDPRWNSRYRDLFNKGDLFLCEGAFMASSIVDLGCHPEKIRVHHLGIDLERIPFTPRNFDPRQPLKILIASTFREKKGIPYAIEALGRLPENVDVKLTIIGDATNTEPDKSEKEKIMRALEKTGLLKKATLRGFLPHETVLQEAYRHHIFLSPSVTASNGDTEGGAPVSIIEMAASGMPVVSTTHCDIPEALNYGGREWLAAERDVDGLVRIFDKWLNNLAGWNDLLLNARRHIDNGYDVLKQGVRLGKIYEELAG